MDMEVDDLPNLPNDIVWFQILTRLPAKSLMRFKCVCKFWSSSFFHDPCFVKAHRDMHKNQNKKTNLLIILGNQSNTSTQQNNVLVSVQLKHDKLGFVNSPKPPAMELLLSKNTSRLKYCSRLGVNGLACLCSTDVSVPVRIFNPCTRELVTLPVSQLQGSSLYNNYHIGYDPLTNEHKVFHMTYKTSDNLEIFNLGGASKSWRDVPKIGLDEEEVFYCKSVCINGAIHWAVMSRKNQTVFILALDVGEERFRVIPFPQECENCSIVYDMIQVHGCLAVFALEWVHDTASSICIWISKDYQNQVWVKECILLPEDNWGKLGIPIPVCTIHTGELLIRCNFGKMHLYDMKRKSYQKTEIELPGLILASYDESVLPLIV